MEREAVEGDSDSSVGPSEDNCERVCVRRGGFKQCHIDYISETCVGKQGGLFRPLSPYLATHQNTL